MSDETTQSFECPVCLETFESARSNDGVWTSSTLGYGCPPPVLNESLLTDRPQRCPRCAPDILIKGGPGLGPGYKV